MRVNNREDSALRAVKITRNYTKHAEGSVLIEFGDTKVICNATVEEKVPPFLMGKKKGWLTAEYAMLPRATHERTKRESTVGKISPRSSEISRLIGRSMRATLDLAILGERQIIIDCDVIQADGGTRTASITGAFVALVDAVNHLIKKNVITRNPIKNYLAAVSVGVYQGQVLVDLDYNEDSNCDSDLNLVMLDNGNIIEIQGTAEKEPFSKDVLDNIIFLGANAIVDLIALQKKVLSS